MASIYCAKTTGSRDEKHLSFGIWCALYKRFYGIMAATLWALLLWQPLSPSSRTWFVNSLTPERHGSNFNSVISEHMSRMKFTSASCEIALRRIPKDLAHDRSMLVQVMFCSRQATSHTVPYLCMQMPGHLIAVLGHQQAQCWPQIYTCFFMIMSSNGNIFRVIGPFCGESTG